VDCHFYLNIVSLKHAFLAFFGSISPSPELQQPVSLTPDNVRHHHHIHELQTFKKVWFTTVQTMCTDDRQFTDVYVCQNLLKRK